MARQNFDDPYRPGAVQDDLRSPSPFDADAPLDPEIRDRRVNGGWIAAFAVAIMLMFAGVFYAMNISSTDPGAPVVANQNSPNEAQNAQPGVRDITPRSNTQPGVTTGAAPAPRGGDAAGGTAGK